MTPISQGTALLRAFVARHPDLTQTDLAGALGCSQQLVSALVARGRIPAQLRVVIALERVCGIPPRAWTEAQSCSLDPECGACGRYKSTCGACARRELQRTADALEARRKLRGAQS